MRSHYIDNIKQYYIVCEGEEEKYSALSNLYGVLTIEQYIIFCQTQKSASWLAGKMVQDGNAVALITGESSIQQRIAVLDRGVTHGCQFRVAKEKLLVTTNLCARGIDIEQMTLVVNYDIPTDAAHRPDCETYLHHTGCMGRFAQQRQDSPQYLIQVCLKQSLLFLLVWETGLAINFVDGQHSMEALQTIKEHFGKPIEQLDTEDAEKNEKIQT